MIFIAFGFSLNAGADPGEGLRLLVDMGVETDFAQRRGRGQACDAGTDDRDGRRVRVPTARWINSP